MAVAAGASYLGVVSAGGPRLIDGAMMAAAGDFLRWQARWDLSPSTDWKNTPCFLAGRLAPESVNSVIRSVGPDAVDVSSGVEFSPGCTDPQRIIRYVEAVVGHHSPS